MKQAIIIAGINGFLGNRLKEILKEYFTVYGIAKEECFDGDNHVFSSSAIEEITIKPDFLILCHAAVSSGNISQSNDLLYDVNVKLTERIISKFNTSKIVYISTASIFDHGKDTITENTIDNPGNEYAISKLWAEKLVLKSGNGVIIRLSSVYGANMKEYTIIPNYVNQALSKNRIEVWGRGNRKQNYIFIDDICKLVWKVLSLHDRVCNQILLGVSNLEYSNLELATIIAEFTKSKIEFIKEDNSTSLSYNNKKTQQLLSWLPEANLKHEVINYIKWKQKQS
ncbi:MAG: SDR family oxidoreductase [Bacteroidota bacterium]